MVQEPEIVSSQRFEEPIPIIRMPTATPTVAVVVPTVEPIVQEQAQVSSVPYPGDDAAIECAQHPDRFNWEPYALAAGFPEHVLPELAHVIQRESSGDLCAVNPSSGAICWIQQISGEDLYYDPAACMAIGYAKWVDGGYDFWRHWYQWW